MQRITLCLWLLLLFGASCQKDDLSKAGIVEHIEENELFLRSVKNLTNIQIHDIFAPPVASRIYLYPSIAAYEAICPNYPGIESYANRLHGLKPLDVAVDTALVSRELAAIYVFNEVGKQLIFSEEKMEDWQMQVDSLVGTWQVNPKVVEASKAYGMEVKQHILAWAKEDNYNQTRTMPKFSVSDDPSRWKPTPPAYMEGIEPHWNKIRTLVLDSAAQFRPPPPPA